MQHKFSVLGRMKDFPIIHTNADFISQHAVHVRRDDSSHGTGRLVNRVW